MLARAIDSYRNLSLEDSADLLNLAWTQDERAFITPDLPSLISQCLKNEVAAALPDIWHYAVDDPWGELRLACAVSHYFSIKEDSFSLACGAGVIQLLSVLTALSVQRNIAVPDEIYPDFPWWLQKAGCRVWRIDKGSANNMVLDAMAKKVDLFFIERPGIRHDSFMQLSAVYELGVMLADAGMTLLIDESNANYQPPSYSAVCLLNRLPNLIVLRGMSKAWGLGGIRTGLCLSSPALKGTLLEILPPLLNPSITLRIAHNLLIAGDSTALLRQRIQQQKRRAIELFEGWPIETASEAMPYIFMPTSENAALERVGIKGKKHHLWQKEENTTTLLRLSVPLLTQRMELLENKLRGDKCKQ